MRAPMCNATRESLAQARVYLCDATNPVLTPSMREWSLNAAKGWIAHARSLHRATEAIAFADRATGDA